jgi:hypothetical protein
MIAMDFVKKRENKEERLYEPIRSALKAEFEVFVGSEGKVYLEKTDKGRFSEELKETLDDRALSISRVEKLCPDITGFVQKKGFSKDLVTVEVKLGKIRIRDLWQAKLYAEVLNAKYGITISTGKIQEEIKRFLTDRPNILYRQGYNNQLVVAQFDVENNEFNFNRKNYPTRPEPFSPIKPLKPFSMKNFVDAVTH